MTKKDLYDAIEETRLMSRFRARIALDLYERVKPMLPEGWEATFDNYRLIFMRFKMPEEATAEKGPKYIAELQLVRSLLKGVTGLEFKLKPQFCGKMLNAIVADEDIKLGTHWRAYINIYLALYETSECKVSVKEKVEIIPEPELLDDCLGGAR